MERIFFVAILVLQIKSSDFLDEVTLIESRKKKVKLSTISLRTLNIDCKILKDSPTQLLEVCKRVQGQMVFCYGKRHAKLAKLLLNTEITTVSRADLAPYNDPYIKKCEYHENQPGKCSAVKALKLYQYINLKKFTAFSAFTLPTMTQAIFDSFSITYDEPPTANMLSAESLSAIQNSRKKFERRKLLASTSKDYTEFGTSGSEDIDNPTTSVSIPDRFHSETVGETSTSTSNTDFERKSTEEMLKSHKSTQTTSSPGKTKRMLNSLWAKSVARNTLFNAPMDQLENSKAPPEN